MPRGCPCYHSSYPGTKLLPDGLQESSARVGGIRESSARAGGIQESSARAGGIRESSARAGGTLESSAQAGGRAQLTKALHLCSAGPAGPGLHRGQCMAIHQHVILEGKTHTGASEVDRLST